MLAMRLRTQHQSLISLLAVVAALLLLAACGPGAQQAVPTAESAPAQDAALPTLPPADAATEGYPAPVVVATPADPYPAGEQPAPAPTVDPAGYPPPEEVFQEPRFRIDQPVPVSATEIAGQAPPDTPLAIVDISYNGAVLGVGRSDANGRFAIPVTGLVEGNRIGLGIGEVPAGQSLEQMAEFYFPHRGEGFMNIPNVGIYFDTTLVGP